LVGSAYDGEFSPVVAIDGQKRIDYSYENSNAVVPIANPAAMQNEKGEVVDLYIPRKWYVMFGLVVAPREPPTTTLRMPPRRPIC
jgi:hypothetical protein